MPSIAFQLSFINRETASVDASCNQSIYAYANHCPHTGSPLDWMPDEFLSIDKKHIQCATHDALFRIDDGRCVSGPCHGDSLEAILVEIRFGWIFLHTDNGKL